MGPDSSRSGQLLKDLLLALLQGSKSEQELCMDFVSGAGPVERTRLPYGQNSMTWLLLPPVSS